MLAHNLGTQTKGLYKLRQWQKENYLQVIKIDRDEDIFLSPACLCFYLIFSQ